MSTNSEPGRELDALRERTAALSAAVLRISSSLDLDTVLQEIAESARALTGARYAVITTIDDARQLEQSVTSGFTPEEARQIEGWTDNLRVFEALRDVPSPLRVANMPAYVASLGFSTEGVIIRTFEGAPMLHGGVQVGNFFLGDKQIGPEFTEEDEEVLVLFASQAATAVANARTHRAERGTRADLEALIETSPVGVVVFDAQNGRLVSINREARRLVEGLRTEGRPVEELVQVATCRFSNGQEIVLSELSLPQDFGSARRLRAEEVVISVPDGRSVTTLVNATPIPSENDEVRSVVVTLQDIAPLQELERQRADFLGMVSHELRAPLTAIKGSAATLLEDSRWLDPAERHEYHRIIQEQADHMRGLIDDLLDAGRIEAGALTVSPEPSEVAELVEGARSTFLSAGGRHNVLIYMPPDLPRVMADRRRIVQVLNNLLWNAARHSPHSAPIRVEAERDGPHVAISVQDEGRGVPPDRLPHLFLRHGQADGSGAGPGIGLGLSICRGLVEAHGGRIRAESGGVGQGARFTFTIPVAGDARQVEAGSAGLMASAGAGTLPAATDAARVLVVDDDPQTLRYVRQTLTEAGYAVTVTGEYEQLSRIIRTEKPHLVLLDLVLPGADGIALMGSVPDLAHLPVVFISGYGRDETIAQALDAGAADYLVKPFSPTELTARVGAALRRLSHPQPFIMGELNIHYEERRVMVAGREIELTATEYDLLRVLSLNAGRVVPYDSLLGQVWSERQAGGANLVRNFVKKLRAKLGDDGQSPAWIFNVRGVGYRMLNPSDG
ncbi:MAG: response regulator [Chloroflexota bacterium]|nr:response regulator [Chloroflexota bacterium]